MTIKKLVSIILLTSIATSAIADKGKKRPRCHDKDECCKNVDFNRTFEVCLSFEQSIVDGMARPASEAPKGDRGKGVSGSIKLCFAKDLSSFHFKLCVCGVKNVKNLNELITVAHLHVGGPNETGRAILFLFDVADRFCGPGIEADGCIAEGTITNEDIRLVERQPFITIASIFAGIQNGEIYANVHGSNFENCAKDGNGDTTDTPSNEFPDYSGGLIRGSFPRGNFPC